MNPQWGNTFLFRSSNQQLPSLILGHKGLFQLTWRPQRALNLDAYDIQYFRNQTTELKGHFLMSSTEIVEHAKTSDSVFLKSRFH